MNWKEEEWRRKQERARRDSEPVYERLRDNVVALPIRAQAPVKTHPNTRLRKRSACGTGIAKKKREYQRCDDSGKSVPAEKCIKHHRRCEARTKKHPHILERRPKSSRRRVVQPVAEPLIPLTSSGPDLSELLEAKTGEHSSKQVAELAELTEILLARRASFTTNLLKFVKEMAETH